MNDHKAKLIIFDCDGILVDSEALSARAFSEVATSLGLDLQPSEALARFRGGSLAMAIKYIEQQLGQSAPPDVERQYRAKSYALFEQYIEAIPGVEDVLKALPNEKCVASNGPKQKILVNLKHTNLLQYFDESHIYSAYDDDIQTWKPDPKLFLFAAQKMGYSPGRCIVIEDSGHGAEAAKQAGMTCFGYARDTKSEELTRHGAVAFDDMHQLLDMIA